MTEVSLRIFLAYASEDKPQVRQLYQRLCGAGYRPWMDEVDLIAGQNWRDEIPQAIEKSDIFIACLSSRSVSKRGYVQREFRLALNQLAEMPAGEIYLIPLKLDDCEIPDLRQAEYGVNLRDIQWLDYWKPRGWERLLQAINYKTGEDVMTDQMGADDWQGRSGDSQRKEKSGQSSQYDLGGAKIGIFAPNAQRNNIIDGDVQGSTIIGTQNNYSSQAAPELDQIVSELRGLLDQLSQNQENTSTSGKMALATQAVSRIEQNSSLRQRIFSALQAGGRSAIEQALNHPAASFLMGALEDWEKSGNR